MYSDSILRSVDFCFHVREKSCIHTLPFETVVLSIEKNQFSFFLQGKYIAPNNRSVNCTSSVVFYAISTENFCNNSPMTSASTIYMNELGRFYLLQILNTIVLLKQNPILNILLDHILLQLTIFRPTIKTENMIKYYSALLQ